MVRQSRTRRHEVTSALTLFSGPLQERKDEAAGVQRHVIHVCAENAFLSVAKAGRETKSAGRMKITTD
jgi:hypothetical protein